LNDNGEADMEEEESG